MTGYGHNLVVSLFCHMSFLYVLFCQFSVQKFTKQGRYNNHPLPLQCGQIQKIVRGSKPERIYSSLQNVNYIHKQFCHFQATDQVTKAYGSFHVKSIKFRPFWNRPLSIWLKLGIDVTPHKSTSHTSFKHTVTSGVRDRCHPRSRDSA